MRNLLQDADRDRLVAPLAGPLARELELGGRRHRALAGAEGGALFPAEGNARAAELLLLPGIRESQARLGDALLDFVMAMEDAPLPCRRAAAGGVEVLSDDPRAVEVVTPFWRLSGDLSRGELRQESRSGLPAAVRHTGNMVEFQAGRHRNCADVESAIVEQSVERRDGGVVLCHVSVIRGTGGWLGAREVEAGRLEMRYEVTPGSPVLRVTARFTAFRRLRRVRVTTALDALDEGGLGATAGRVLSKASWRDTRPLPTPGVLRWAQDERVDHVAVGAAGWPSGAKVLHLRPLDPAKVMSVTVESRRDAAAHWLITRHGMVDLRAGGTLVAEEDRLLGSGDVASVAAAMARGAQGLDLDSAPPSGAALHAVATALAFDATGAWRERLTEARRAELAGFATRHLARLEAGEAEGVDFGYAALASDALRRAGVVGAEVQARLVARLVARLDDAGVLRGPGAPSLAAQALAALAFARAACGPCGEEAAAALAAALGAVTAAGGALDFAGAKVETAVEAEGVALLTRAAGAAVLAAEAGAPVPAQAVERGRQLHRIGVNLLRPMVQPRTGMLAVLGPAGIAPGLQALVTLALMAPERLVLGAPAPA